MSHCPVAPCPPLCRVARIESIYIFAAPHDAARHDRTNATYYEPSLTRCPMYDDAQVCMQTHSIVGEQVFFICLCFYQVQDAVAVHSLIHNHIIQCVSIHNTLCSRRVHVPMCLNLPGKRPDIVYTTRQDVEYCLSVAQVSAVNRFSPPLEVVAAQDHRTNTKLAVQNKPASLRFRFTSSSPSFLPSFLPSLLLPFVNVYTATVKLDAVRMKFLCHLIH